MWGAARVAVVALALPWVSGAMRGQLSRVDQPGVGVAVTVNVAGQPVPKPPPALVPKFFYDQDLSKDVCGSTELCGYLAEFATLKTGAPADWGAFFSQGIGWQNDANTDVDCCCTPERDAKAPYRHYAFCFKLQYSSIANDLPPDQKAHRITDLGQCRDDDASSNTWANCLGCMNLPGLVPGQLSPDDEVFVREIDQDQEYCSVLQNVEEKSRSHITKNFDFTFGPPAFEYDEDTSKMFCTGDVPTSVCESYWGPLVGQNWTKGTIKGNTSESVKCCCGAGSTDELCGTLQYETVKGPVRKGSSYNFPDTSIPADPQSCAVLKNKDDQHSCGICYAMSNTAAYDMML